MGGDVDGEWGALGAVDIGHVDFGGVVDDKQGDFLPEGPAVLVLSLILEGVDTPVAGDGLDAQGLVVVPFEGDKGRDGPK